MSSRRRPQLHEDDTSVEPRAESRLAVAPGWTPDPRGPRTPDGLLALQRRVGNSSVVTLFRQAEQESSGIPEEQATATEGPLEVTEELVPDQEGGAPDTAGPAVDVGFVSSGMTGVIPFGDAAAHHGRCPHAYLDGGMTGTIAWSGGGGAGAHGNQPTGSIQTQIPPTFTARPGPAAGRFSSRVRRGTGKITVRRSYLGAFAGNQHNGWYLTLRAARTVNAHERHHVANTRAQYQTNLSPLERRVANAALGRSTGATAVAAIAAHQAAINWAASITAFQTADNTANQPGGTVDTADVAAGWIVDLGPGTVHGHAFNHRVTTATEPAPPA